MPNSSTQAETLRLGEAAEGRTRTVRASGSEARMSARSAETTMRLTAGQARSARMTCRIIGVPPTGKQRLVGNAGRRRHRVCPACAIPGKDQRRQPLDRVHVARDFS